MSSESVIYVISTDYDARIDADSWTTRRKTLCFLMGMGCRLALGLDSELIVITYDMVISASREDKCRRPKKAVAVLVCLEYFPPRLQAIHGYPFGADLLHR